MKGIFEVWGVSQNQLFYFSFTNTTTNFVCIKLIIQFFIINLFFFIYLMAWMFNCIMHIIYIGKNIVSSPSKIRRGVLVFGIWTMRGVMKKLLRNRGLGWNGGVLLKRGRFPYCFISFHSEKHAFITNGFFFSGKYSRLL